MQLVLTGASKAVVSDETVGTKSMIESGFFGDEHPLFGHFGIKIDSVKTEKASMKMPYSETLSDSRGALHHGAIVTLLDTNCGLAVFSARNSMKPVATLDLRVDFLNDIPPTSGIKSEVECIGFDGDMAFVSGRAICPDNSQVVAVVTGSFAINTLGPELGQTKTKGKTEVAELDVVSADDDVDAVPLSGDAFTRFLGLYEQEHLAESRYAMQFREVHLGNPQIRTFHGGILAGFGEIVAAHFVAKQNGWNSLPACKSLTIDYMRPAFAGEVVAKPRIVYKGRRFVSVAVEVSRNKKVACIGRYIFKTKLEPGEAYV